MPQTTTEKNKSKRGCIGFASTLILLFSLILLIFGVHDYKNIIAGISLSDTATPTITNLIAKKYSATKTPSVSQNKLSYSKEKQELLDASSFYNNCYNSLVSTIASPPLTRDEVNNFDYMSQDNRWYSFTKWTTNNPNCTKESKIFDLVGQFQSNNDPIENYQPYNDSSVIINQLTNLPDDIYFKSDSLFNALQKYSDSETSIDTVNNAEATYRSDYSLVEKTLNNIPSN